MVRKGGQLKVHARSTWGEGGQKRPKNGPHGLCITPNPDNPKSRSPQIFYKVSQPFMDLASYLFKIQKCNARPDFCLD